MMTDSGLLLLQAVVDGLTPASAGPSFSLSAAPSHNLNPSHKTHSVARDPHACFICCTDYDSDAHYPTRTIPCVHFLCRACAVEWFKGTSKCPACSNQAVAFKPSKDYARILGLVVANDEIEAIENADDPALATLVLKEEKGFEMIRSTLQEEKEDEEEARNEGHEQWRQDEQAEMRTALQDLRDEETWREERRERRERRRARLERLFAQDDEADNDFDPNRPGGAGAFVPVFMEDRLSSSRTGPTSVDPGRARVRTRSERTAQEDRRANAERHRRTRHERHRRDTRSGGSVGSAYGF